MNTVYTQVFETWQVKIQPQIPLSRLVFVFVILKQALSATESTTRSQARWRTRRKKHGDPAYGRECRKPSPWRGKPRNSPRDAASPSGSRFSATGGCQGGVRLFGVTSMLEIFRKKDRQVYHDLTWRRLAQRPATAAPLRPKAVPEGTRTPRLAPFAPNPRLPLPSLPFLLFKTALPLRRIF